MALVARNKVMNHPEAVMSACGSMTEMALLWLGMALVYPWPDLGSQFEGILGFTACQGRRASLGTVLPRALDLWGCKRPEVCLRPGPKHTGGSSPSW